MITLTKPSVKVQKGGALAGSGCIFSLRAPSLAHPAIILIASRCKIHPEPAKALYLYKIYYYAADYFSF